MRLSTRRDDRTRLRRRLEENRVAIEEHLATAPDSVDEREDLWIERSRIMERLGL